MRISVLMSANVAGVGGLGCAAPGYFLTGQLAQVISGASGWPVFFYGLFMDVEVLRGRGLSPGPARHAIVQDFALSIGQRATLVEEPGATVHGMVIALTPSELVTLYAEPSVRVYRPRAVLAVLDDADELPVLAYVLPVPPESGQSNLEYAAKLRDLCSALKFPAGYVSSIR